MKCLNEQLCKVQALRSRKALRIEVKLYSRRFGDLERARAHAMLYQMLPLVFVRLYGP
ncbi:hypothetical protein Hanom_Chr07g00660851 [Helianthus anomalus]